MGSIRYFCLAVLLLAASACSATKAYTGPTLPASELATINGASTLCHGSFYINKFDGQFEGQDLQAPAGTHRMQVIRVSTPYIGNDPSTPFFPECVRVTGYQVSFEVQAQRTYWFYVDDGAGPDAQVSVWQSTGSGPEGQQIPSQSEKLWSHRNCFIDGRYGSCFPGA